jgi:hypothetical protein
MRTRLATLVAVILLAFLGNFIFLLDVWAGVPTEMIGVWSSATLDGMGPVSRPECRAMSLTDRKVTLKAVPGTDRVEGEWVRWTRSVWMSSDNQKCRWFPDDDQYEPIVGAIWTYSVEGSYDRQRQVLKVHGNYSNCLGNACNKWHVHDSTFHTELKVVAGTLVDTNETVDTSDDVEFVQLEDDLETIEEARTTTEGWLKKLDLGDIDGFYDQATTGSFRQSVNRSDFHNHLAELQGQSGLITSRQFLLSTHVLYAPGFAKGKGNYILFSNKIVSSKQLVGMEFLLLAKENGQWRVLWLNYGS